MRLRLELVHTLRASNAGYIQVRNPGTAARGRPFSLGRHAWDLSGLPWRAASRHEAEFELGHHSPLTTHLARAIRRLPHIGFFLRTMGHLPIGEAALGD